MTQSPAKSDSCPACRPAYVRVYLSGLAALVAMVMATIWFAAGNTTSAGPDMPSDDADRASSQQHAAVSDGETGVNGPPFVLVELFTSEGCSSCPSADRLLKQLRDEMTNEGRPMVALSWHVDYWDKLGWPDPFSSEKASDRQRWYAKVLGQNKLYTPQMVVDGQKAIVGSSERDARLLLKGADWDERPVELALTQVGELSDEQLGVSYSARGPMHTGELHIALVSREETVEVPRGENAGRELNHVEVVRDLVTIPVKGNEEVSGKVCFEASAGMVAADPDEFRMVAWVQCNETGHILAGTTMKVGAGTPHALEIDK